MKNEPKVETVVKIYLNQEEQKRRLWNRIMRQIQREKRYKERKMCSKSEPNIIETKSESI